MNAPTDFTVFARLKEYVDPHGVMWNRRGGVLGGRSLGRRIRATDVRVMHHYLGTFSTIDLDSREQFWQLAVERMRRSGHSRFVGSEFKNDAGEHLLVVDEDC